MTVDFAKISGKYLESDCGIERFLSESNAYLKDAIWGNRSEEYVWSALTYLQNDGEIKTSDIEVNENYNEIKNDIEKLSRWLEKGINEKHFESFSKILISKVNNTDSLFSINKEKLNDLWLPNYIHNSNAEEIIDTISDQKLDINKVKSILSAILQECEEEKIINLKAFLLVYTYLANKIDFCDLEYYYLLPSSHYHDKFRSVYFCCLKSKSKSKEWRDYAFLHLHKIFSIEYIKETMKVEQELFKHARKVANITILVDSFSHNIAAHSLTALSQYFAERKAMLEKENITNELLNRNSETPVLTKNLIEEIKDRVGKQNEGLSLAEVLRNGNKDLLKNLLSIDQKGRDSVTFPVPIDDSLQYFINYLYEKAEFWSAVIAGESFSHSIQNIYDLLHGFVNNPLFIGTLSASEGLNKIRFIVDDDEFAFVDFLVIQESDPYSANYHFIREGEQYESVKQRLTEKKVWLPGGNVGRQSVYTIIENCLRNIKHYDIEKIKTDGIINFHLDIQGPTYDKFELKMYLGHTDYYDDETVAIIVDKIKAKIEKGTFDNENAQPVMGGTSQSILCAQQLLSGKFISDHTENSKKDHDKPFQVSQKNGYVDYSFKLWQGDKCNIISNSQKINSNENLNRFMFLVAKPASCILADLKRSASDMVRVLESDQEGYQEIYKEWVRKWLGNEKFNKGIKLLFDNESYSVPDVSRNEIVFSHAHNDSAKLHFRNHGVFVKQIKSHWENCKYEIMESMLTGIYVVDDRLYNIWKSKKNINKYESKLNLFIKSESDPNSLADNEVKLKNGELYISADINFLIIHLSFLEKLSQEFKDDIDKFFRIVKNTVAERENFYLMITTGRARSEWKESIAEEFKDFVKYRSVFSMQKVLLNASMIDDDFDAKYNLTKVLFGS